MDTRGSLLDHIRSLEIVDTHEHLPFEEDRPRETDVLAKWLSHYFSCDLVSAGLSDAGLTAARDPARPLEKRWRIVEPYWRAAENTGYGRSLSIAARDIYGVDRIDGRTIGELDRRFREARQRGGHYRFVLKEKSRIAVSIRDSMPVPYRETGDPFVFALRADEFVRPGHWSRMRAMGEDVGVGVHTLEDWADVARRHVERHINGGTRVVCIKCGLAYQRSLRFDRTGHAEAERAFNEAYADRHLPDWRQAAPPAKALEDWMMHTVCRIADDNRLVVQFHTGLQEGNGNFIPDSNPVLLTNLFLEYRNARFDVFHMGYPYTAELGVLAKNFRNVFIDMCWGHIINPEAARRALIEWLDAVPANKISAFGGDYCFVDGVYGHQFLARRNVAAALAVKVADGSVSLSAARETATRLFVETPKELFGLGRFIAGEKRGKAVRRGGKP